MEPHCAHRRGFSLIELLVVLTIITVVTLVVFTSQGSFNKTVILSNTAYDVALTIRFTETYGLGSRAHNAAVNTGYGLHFERSVTDHFTMFADTFPSVGSRHEHTDDVCHWKPDYDETGPSALAGDCVYTPDADPTLDERVQDYMLGNGVTIKDFCAEAAGVWACANSDNGGPRISSLDIVFARPNPTPFMSKNGAYLRVPSVTGACITLTSLQGEFKYITVGASGQISANAAPCAAS